FQAGAIAAGVSGPARAEKHVVAHGGSSNPALLKWSLPKHPQRPPTSLEPGARRKARGGARWKLKSCPAQVELTEAPAKAAGLGGSHQQPHPPGPGKRCLGLFTAGNRSERVLRAVPMRCRIGPLFFRSTAYLVGISFLTM